MAIFRTLFPVFVAAIAFRVALFFSGFVDVVFETNDSWQYLDMGRSLLTGTFAEGGVITMNRTPGYPAFLAAVFTVFGDSQFAVTASQIAVDALTCVLVVHMALFLRLKRWAVGLVGTLVVTFLFTSTFTFEVMSETLYTFLLTFSIWVLLVPGKKRTNDVYRTTPLCALLAGISSGCGVLVRPSLSLALLSFVALMFIFSVLKNGLASSLTPKKLIVPALFSIGLLASVVPWMARNYLTFPQEYADGLHSEQVTLLGMKSGIPTGKILYTKEYSAFLRSQEEPFVQTKLFNYPAVVRFVYEGEESDSRKAFEKLERDVLATTIYSEESLPEFAEITRKRYAAAPRLHVTAPASKFLKLWISPRIAILWIGTSGHNSGLPLIILMTLYSLLYVVLGFVGIRWLWKETPTAAIYLISMIIGHSLVHMYVFPITLSRYAIPVFPLFCLPAGFLAQYIADRFKRFSSAA